MRARDLQSHQARLAEPIRPDLALLEWHQMEPSTLRQQPGQVLRMLNGSLRRSSPSLTNTSTA